MLNVIAWLLGRLFGAALWLLRVVCGDARVKRWSALLMARGLTMVTQGMTDPFVRESLVEVGEARLVGVSEGLGLTQGGILFTGGPVNPVRPPTPQEEAAKWAGMSVIADCGPYAVLSATPPGEHSHFWMFDIFGPGFTAPITVVGIDETCGRSIIGGLATAWHAGRNDGIVIGRDQIVSGLAQSNDPAILSWIEKESACPTP